MVGALPSASSVEFLGKTLNHHGASLHPGAGIGNVNDGGNPAMD